MNDPWKDRWNERYSKEAYAYGEQPNNYLKAQLDKLPVGNILFAAEGEGRNAVYAAELGWMVTAFDISMEGKNKAMRLAEKHKVTINYLVGEMEKMNFKPGQFDAIALIYAHFPADIKSSIHLQLVNYLRKGGTIIFEAFSKNHLTYNSKNPKVGGPKEIDVLFSIEEVRANFVGYEVEELVEKEIELHEGVFHNGLGSVIRYVGKKK